MVQGFYDNNLPDMVSRHEIGTLVSKGQNCRLFG